MNDAHPVGLRDAVEVHLAGSDRHHEADTDAKQDRKIGHEALENAGKQQDRQEHDGGDGEREGRAIGGVRDHAIRALDHRLAACRPVDPHTHQ